MKLLWVWDRIMACIIWHQKYAQASKIYLIFLHGTLLFYVIFLCCVRIIWWWRSRLWGSNQIKRCTVTDQYYFEYVTPIILYLQLPSNHKSCNLWWHDTLVQHADPIAGCLAKSCHGLIASRLKAQYVQLPNMFGRKQSRKMATIGWLFQVGSAKQLHWSHIWFCPLALGSREVVTMWQ